MLTIAQQELDFEYWEARKAFGQERILASKYLADWFNSYDRDWVHVQLGNKCDWCGRTNNERKLQVDHIFPKLRAKKSTETLKTTVHDYLKGEPLRLLCIDCHKMRHTI